MNFSRFLLIAAVTAALPSALFAVDGQILINQSTVMSSGGFPFRITQTGSYKLAGNLVAPIDQQAIIITASNVTLDLNGFNVTCSYDANLSTAYVFLCISDGHFYSGVADVTLRNGTVNVTQVGSFFLLTSIECVEFYNSVRLTVEDLHIVMNGSVSGIALDSPLNSIILNTVLVGGSLFKQCPSVFANTINTSGLNGGGSGCAIANSVGVF
jgi:hypothetical protein